MNIQPPSKFKSYYTIVDIRQKSNTFMYFCQRYKENAGKYLIFHVFESVAVVVNDNTRIYDEILEDNLGNVYPFI